MPTYYTPPPSPIPAALPPSHIYPPHANSFSHPSTTTTTPSSSRTRPAPNKPNNPTEPKTKAPYIFLGSIAAASLLAHKYWPRGYPHSDKEDWELSGLARRTKERRLAEKAEKAERAARRRSQSGSGGGSSGRRGGSVGFGVDGMKSGGGYRDEGWGRGGYHRGMDGGEYGRFDYGGGGWGREMGSNDGWERGRERRGSFASHSRSVSRGGQRDYSVDGYVETPYRRAGSRDVTEGFTTTDRYYPTAPKRYLLEQSASTTGSSSSGSRYVLERSSSNAGSRSTGSSQRGYYEEDRPGEVIYVYRNPPARARRASFDAGGVRREGHDWYYR